MKQRYFKVRISNALGQYDKYYEHFYEAIQYIRQCGTAKIALNVAYHARRLQYESGTISFPLLDKFCILESLEGNIEDTKTVRPYVFTVAPAAVKQS